MKMIYIMLFRTDICVLNLALKGDRVKPQIPGLNNMRSSILTINTPQYAIVNYYHNSINQNETVFYLNKNRCLFET